MKSTQRDGIVVLPSFNSGKKLVETVRAALDWEYPVTVVLDGCTDGSGDRMRAEFGGLDRLKILENATNLGKGAAVLRALDAASEQNIRHALVMDADGQHPADRIGEFLSVAAGHPDAMVLGVPVFGPDAPPERVKGRRVGNWFANLETLWGGIHDSLFGFRAYPVELSRKTLHSIRTARRYDFDTELAVRLYWAGVRPINIPVPVTYPPPEEGGVSHFRYLRDNLLLTGTHTRLTIGMLLRFSKVIALRKKNLAPANAV